MIFNTFGNSEKPVVIMLAGSFCPPESMENIYSVLKDSYYIIAPDYNGQYEGSKDFTTRREEAAEIKQYLEDCGISAVRMIYGQSMGSEIGIELMSQLISAGIKVESSFFDGAPCIKLSRAYKAIMYLKFRSMLKMLKGKSMENIMDIGVIRMFYKNDPDSARCLIEPMLTTLPYITERTIKNENECCYTFDFPPFDEETQCNMHFFYDKNEKACRLCMKYVKRAYPKAEFEIVSGYAHLTYAFKNTDIYVKKLAAICEGVKEK